MKSVQLIETPKRLYVIIMSPRRLSTSESTLYNYVNVKELLARKRNVFIGNFEQILDLSLMSVYLTLNRQMLTG